MENLFYHERNQDYLNKISDKIKSEALQKGFYGIVNFEIKINDGIVQIVTYSKETRISGDILPKVDKFKSLKESKTSMGLAFKKALGEENE